MKKVFLLVFLVCSLKLADAQSPTPYLNTHYGPGEFASNISANYNAGFGNSVRDYSFKGVKIPQNASDHYSIRYAEFGAPLIKVVQELTAIVEEQRKEISALKTQVDATREKNATTSEATGLPQRAVLYQNHPNPSSTETEINVYLPDNTENANLVFYTVDGKQLKLLHLFNRGDFTVKVDNNELTRGVCFYALMVEGKIIDSKRLLVTR